MTNDKRCQSKSIVNRKLLSNCQVLSNGRILLTNCSRFCGCFFVAFFLLFRPSNYSPFLSLFFACSLWNFPPFPHSFFFVAHRYSSFATPRFSSVFRPLFPLFHPRFLPFRTSVFPSAFCPFFRKFFAFFFVNFSPCFTPIFPNFSLLQPLPSFYRFG